MHGNALRARAVLVDARKLRVECPEHPGLLLPVTHVKVARHHATSPTDQPTTRLYLEVLCPYCDRYHYVEVAQGPVAAAGDGLVLSLPDAASCA